MFLTASSSRIETTSLFATAQKPRRRLFPWVLVSSAGGEQKDTQTPNFGADLLAQT